MEFVFMLNKIFIFTILIFSGCLDSNTIIKKQYGGFKDHLNIKNASCEPIQNIAASIVGRHEEWAIFLKQKNNDIKQLDSISKDEFTISGDGGMGDTTVKRIFSRGECSFIVIESGIEDETDLKETSIWHLRNGYWYIELPE